MCILVTDAPSPAALREISGAGAIDASVCGFDLDGIRIAFSGDSSAVAFALTAITTDMTRG